MKHTPITTYDKRTIRAHGLEYRQVGTKPGLPIQIEHRKVGSQWWDIAYGDAQHTQEAWAIIVAEGVIVA